MQLPVLLTKRLLLRSFLSEDLEAVHLYAKDPETTKYMHWGPNTIEATKDFIHHSIQQGEKNPIIDFDYAVTLKETGRLIGGCGIYKEKNAKASLGWILHKDFHRQGFGGEVAAILRDFAFYVLSLDEIYTTCHNKNIASYSVMEKIGMTRQETTEVPISADSLNYSLKRDDFNLYLDKNASTTEGS